MLAWRGASMKPDPKSGVVAAVIDPDEEREKELRIKHNLAEVNWFEAGRRIKEQQGRLLQFYKAQQEKRKAVLNHGKNTESDDELERQREELERYRCKK